MNKYDKLHIAGIIQDINSLITGNVSNNIASTVGSLVAEAERDGIDAGDISKLALDQSFDQDRNGTIQKILNNLNIHYKNIQDELTKRNDRRGLYALETLKTNKPDFITLGNSLYDLLWKFEKHSDGGSLLADEEVAIIKVGNKTFKLLVANTKEEKENGLKNVASMKDDEGMLFDYPEVQDEVSFWMQDTSIPLDIIFVDENDIVKSVKKGEPNSLKMITESHVSYVIELNESSGVKRGDEIVFENSIADTKQPPSNEEELKILDLEGETQAVLQGSERIFSIKNTKTLVSMAKRAYETQSEADFKALGKKVFEYMENQDSSEPEYVEE